MSAKSKRLLARLNDPRRREKLLLAMNRENMDDVGPLGSDQGMAVLKEMNELQSGYEEFVKSLAPRVDAM